MTTHIIGCLITLKPAADQKAFEDFLVEQSNTEHVFEQVAGTQFLFHKQLGADRKYVWITRFPESEFQRVSRAAVPFILSAFKGILEDIQARQADVELAFSTRAEKLDQLKAKWNADFGRFGQIFTT